MHAESVRKFECIHFDATDACFHLLTRKVFKRPIPQLLQLIKVSDNSIETNDTNGPSGMTKQFYGGIFKSINKLAIFVAANRVIFRHNIVLYIYSTSSAFAEKHL